MAGLTVSLLAAAAPSRAANSLALSVTPASPTDAGEWVIHATGEADDIDLLYTKFIARFGSGVRPSP